MTRLDDVWLTLLHAVELRVDEIGQKVNHQTENESTTEGESKVEGAENPLMPVGEWTTVILSKHKRIKNRAGSEKDQVFSGKVCRLHPQPYRLRR